jgi:hypothetical protein
MLSRTKFFLFFMLALLPLGCGNSSDFVNVGSGDVAGEPRLIIESVLARSVPDAITQLRITGTDTQGRVLVGPVLRDKAPRIEVAMTTEVKTVIIEYLEGLIVVGSYQQNVDFSNGGTVTIVDPAWVDTPHPHRLGFVLQPSDGLPGEPLFPAVQVALLDDNGQTIPGATVPVTIALGTNPVGATLSGNLTVIPASGLATFSDLAIDQQGVGFTLVASAPGLGSVTSQPFTVAPTPQPTTLQFLRPPTSVEANRLFTPPIQVAVLDQIGRPFPNPVTVTLDLAENQNGGTLSGTLSRATSQGVASFDDLTLDQLGPGYVLRAQAGDATPLLSNPFEVLQRQVNFLSPNSQNIGQYIRELESADLDGDNVPDLVSAGQVRDQTNSQQTTSPRSLAGLLGAGDGTFPTQTGADAGRNPYGLDLGDLNGDGIPDAVVADQSYQAGFTSLLGTGDGNFDTGRVFGAAQGQYLHDVVLLDYNRDGDLDVAGGYYNGYVSLFPGNGDGTFGEPIQLSGTYNTYSYPELVVGDFDGQNGQDLAVITGVYYNNYQGRLQVFLNQGDGSYSLGQDFTLSYQLYYNHRGTLGDLNEDGIQDLIIASADNNQDYILVLLGQAGGTFGAPTARSGLEGPWDVETGDYNEDGFLDVTTADYYGHQVALMLGDGTGALGEPSFVNIGFYPQSLTGGDFNNDGHLDVATGDTYGTLYVLLGDGEGQFQTVGNEFEVIDTGGNGQGFPAAGDLNGDGRADLVIPNRSRTNQDTGNVGLLLGNGSGGFPTLTEVETGGRPVAVGVSDLNGDGRPDVVVANEVNSVSILINADTTGTNFTVTSLPTGGESYGVAIGDLNGDSEPDLAIAHNNGVNLFFNDGSGNFMPVPIPLLSQGQYSAIDIGDLNDDGTPDLAVGRRSAAGLTLLFNDGMGAFGDQTTIQDGPCWQLLVRDFNQDGRDDIALPHYDNSSTVSVLYQQANGTFANTELAVGSDELLGLAAADLHGDGLLDLITGSGYSDASQEFVGVFLNRGSSYDSMARYPVGAGNSIWGIATADFNSDGLIDLAVSRDNGGVVIMPQVP